MDDAAVLFMFNWLPFRNKRNKKTGNYLIELAFNKESTGSNYTLLSKRLAVAVLVLLLNISLVSPSLLIHYLFVP